MAASKKFRSKFFRVAVEGATTDGRTIERQWLVDAAETYNPNTYGARVWLEHFRSVLPDGPFKAYGDVVALKTEEVEVAGKKKLALFAQIEPTADLIALNKARQKIFTSIEIRPKFADTGRAYLDGIAVTDTPASLGTEMLTFSAQHPDANPLKSRKNDPDNLFSEAIEIALEFEEVTDSESKVAGLFSRVMDALGKSKDKAVKDDAQFSELTEAIEALATHAKEQGEAFTEEVAARTDLVEKVTKLTTDFNDLVKRLGDTEDRSQKSRPPATGGGDKVLTQF
ncbi:Phage capsid scaffolding protein (GPO) serine peptidase [Pseudomonas putida]|nr:Phage capsid scaffolding protein (GPO) serine peptidase [Pseudomonas putida]CAC9678990.1 Phage capsid scaffolding protein (GPO) serine peptidase [Pseudomonas putida]CAC9680416.1 Phage capsid scaffolding protein (GPO) serine peptidase [Pseudomonas putida]CAC9690408.1 Phage capsid scaffolding protein (GPO) serine peptidase [Pseudomonas putida]CAC9690890.1 Phage capsid scaffolding protein (GPO) serine peptidase [Pseudomonas putida]